MKFRRGEIVVLSKPFATAVGQTLFKTVCSGCLRERPALYSCARCGHLRYCDRQCQKTDWRGHRYECRIFAKFALDYLPNEYSRLLARCLRRADTEPDTSEQICGVRRTIKSLVVHEEAKAEADVMQFFAERYLELRTFYKDITAKPDDVLEMFLRIWVNCQSLGEEQPLGIALYLGQSAIDHSCARDHRYGHFYHGTTFVIKALEDAELDFDDIRIPYCNLLQPRSDRQAQLSRWYFTCACPVCSGQLPEIVTTSESDDDEHCVGAVDNSENGSALPVQPLGNSSTKLARISAQLRTTSDPVSVLKAAIACEPEAAAEPNPASKLPVDVHLVRDHTTLQSVWLLAFNALPSAGRHVEAVPYLRAILAFVRRVHGVDGYYHQVLGKALNVCRSSPDAMAMLTDETAEHLELNELLSLGMERDSSRRR
ncbi:hypothetical protein BIW11_13251 [Tropilaelaps mercedesae]|uniref:MYND-type domain-containing protein n=1 Tax=Tropilaelaps mercedesae TaxID=418985 RepID=A0A1V9X3B3_9ACAR|nr:hypothetical protein BIW11_13251 [Tropilaelaps mercedesae]